MFWLKVWNTLKKFPVFMSIAIILPVTIYFFRSAFIWENYYFNLNYDGERIDVEHEKFAITNIKPLFKIMDISSFSNYQGGAFYENYYALCSNNFECILIYDMQTQKVAHQIFTNMTDTEYHCNTCFFGPTFYASRDKFPLLYISMENESVEKTVVVRIDQNATKNQVTVVQEINFVVDDEEKVYLPNSYYDYENKLLYYAGYTKPSYMKSEDNFLRYYAFDLPDHRIENYELKTSESVDRFNLPSETATQGGFISDGYLYQTFSFNSQTDPLKMPKFRVVNLEEKKIIYDNQNLGLISNIYDEFENVAIGRDGKLYAFGIRSLKIFEFEFSGKTSEK